MIITNARQQRPLTIQGTGDDIRDWLYVVDNCQAIDLVMRKGVAGKSITLAALNAARC